jgi:hypothetical protein
MTIPQQSMAFSAALVVLLLAFLLWSGIYAGGPTPKPSVMFVGMTNNPTRQMTPTRVEVTEGATGLCALFRVTNIATKEHIWFRTALVEQKTEAGWKPFVPSGASWCGVGGSQWSPGYSCLIAVGWPPGLATNATWRLQLRYGRDPSTLGTIVNQKTGWELFPSGKEESTIPSSEVNQ